jgi:hypothetical protein
METVDRTRMCEAVYPVLSDARSSGRMSAAEIEAVIASCAEGYAFPTNLDRDPPAGGLAPKSQQALLRDALEQCWPNETLRQALREHARKRSV